MTFDLPATTAFLTIHRRKLFEVALLMGLYLAAVRLSAGASMPFEINRLYIAEDFLLYLAPGIIGLVLILGLLHHGLTHVVPRFAINGASRRLPLYFYAPMVMLLGCTKVLVTFSPVFPKMSVRQKVILLAMCFSSSGGITFLSAASLGYPLWLLLLPIVLLPIFSALLLSLLPERDSRAAQLDSHIQQCSLSRRMWIYFEGGYKMVANRLSVIALIELLSQTQSDLFSQIALRLTGAVHTWLTWVGFPQTIASDLSQYWLMKHMVSKDWGLISLSNNMAFSSLSPQHQAAVMVLLGNIVCIAGAAIVSLNIVALFGRRDLSLVAVLPLALFIAFFSAHVLAAIIVSL